MFIFVTSSPDKVREAEEILSEPMEQFHRDIPELQSIWPQDVIEHKAELAYKEAGRPILVEDSGLHFKAWGGLPGAMIKWFLKAVETEGLCRMLDNFPTREATAISVVAYYDGREIKLGRGSVEGRIADHPRGRDGFGWDSIFIPEGFDKTFAEMSKEEKNKISYRRKALENLKAVLQNGA